MMVTGFDQAAKLIGFAYGEPGGIPTRGVQLLPDYGENTARLGKYVREWVINLGKSIGVERGYFEQVLVRKHGFHMPTYRKQIRVADSIEIAFELLGLEDEVHEVDVADWRREFYAGARPTKGQDSESTAWKDMALKECLRRNWLVDDHNAAEACGIWFYGCLHSDADLRRQHKVDVRRAQLRREREAA